MQIEFTSTPGKTFVVVVRDPGANYAALATGIAAGEIAAGRYRANVGTITGLVWIEATAGATKCLGFADLSNPAANGFAHVVDSLVAVDVVAISDAVAEAVNSAGVTLSDADIASIGLAVYRRLVGGSVGLLELPTSGDPLDVIHSTDFSYTFDADVAVGSSFVFTIKRDAADEIPKLEITSSGGLVTVNGSAAANSGDGAIVRLSATQCRVTIRARSLVLVAPGPYVAEFRELATGNVTKSKHEINLNLRRSASRAIA
jgi:hypothetical protein